MTLPDLLQKVVELEGSDLHLTTKTPPQIRVHGHLERLDGPDLAPADTKQLTYSVLTDAQKKRFEEKLELDFSFGIQGVGRFRCNMFYQRGAVGAVYRLIPEKIRSFQELSLPAGARDARRKAARPHSGHRADRQRQVDDAGRDDRQDQQGAAGSHPDDRGSDRVRAPASGLSRQPARGAPGHAELLERAARGASRGPGHRADRRDARPRDGRVGAAHCGNRTPDVRHAAHQLRGADDQPNHRHLSRRISRARFARSCRSCSRQSSVRRCFRRLAAAASCRSRS